LGTKKELVYSHPFDGMHFCDFKRNKNYYSLKLIVMSLFNTGKNKKDKKKNAPASNKSSMFIAPKGGGKANTKTSSNAGKHVGGAQRGA
jgi:hypothetical protein